MRTSKIYIGYHSDPGRKLKHWVMVVNNPTFKELIKLLEDTA